MSKILITGGSGFIGSNLASELYKLGHEVTVLDNLSPQIHGDNPNATSPLYNSIKHKVCFILGTINDKTLLQKALVNQDIIVHYAAETGTGQSMYEIEKYNHVNIGGTATLLDILANSKHCVKKIVVASSRSIYGEGKYFSKKHGIVYPEHRKQRNMDQGLFEVSHLDDKQLEIQATDEDSKVHPSSVYGITKQVQEQLIMTVCPSLNIAPVSLRYQNVYGPGQSLSNPYTGILSIFSTLILQNKSINIFEDGAESRDFVYISDVVDATILAIFNDNASGNIYNVGSGIRTSVKSVVEQLLKNYETSVPVKISGNYRLGDIRHNFADLTKINADLGFSPKVNFELGIKEFTKWVRSINLKDIDNKFDDSLREMKSKGMFK